MNVNEKNHSFDPSWIKSPLWKMKDENLQDIGIIRDVLNRCSRGRIVEMLKQVLFAEEKTALVKSDLETFFQFKIQAFEKHVKMNNPVKVTKHQFVRNNGK